MSTLTETVPARDDRAASILEDQVAAYKRDGFLIIEDVLQGVELEVSRPPSRGRRPAHESTGRRAERRAKGSREMASITHRELGTRENSSISIRFICSSRTMPQWR